MMEDKSVFDRFKVLPFVIKAKILCKLFDDSTVSTGRYIKSMCFEKKIVFLCIILKFENE